MKKEMQEKGNNKEDILEKLEKKRKIKIILTLTIMAILVGIIIFISFSIYSYYKSPERELGLGANIESALISEDGKTSYIKLSGGSNIENITKIKFIFTDSKGNEYVYETSEGIQQIEVPFKRSFWDWLFGKPKFKGKYEYRIKAESAGLYDFQDIVEVGVLFEYYEEGQKVDTGILDTEKPTNRTTTGGGGGDGGGGTTTTTTCPDTCASLGYECGTHTICSREVSCGDFGGDCDIGYLCNSNFKCEIDVCYGITCSDYNETECESNPCLSCRWNNTGCVENVYYIRAGAPAGGDGLSWTTAWQDLNDATKPDSSFGLVRGATYYIADGNYSGYVFDDDEQNDSYGNPMYITIKKATMDEHGTETGWNDSYAEPAIWNISCSISGRLNFKTDYWVFDGVTGGYPNWTSGHGFKVYNMEGGDCSMMILLGRTTNQLPVPDYIEIKHVEFARPNRITADRPADTVIYGTFRYYENGTEIPMLDRKGLGSQHLTLSYNYFRHMQIFLKFGFTDNTLIEYNYFERNYPDTTGTNQATVLHDGGSDNMIIRHNIFKDIQGTGIIDMKGNFEGQTNNNWSIYGNVFYYDPNAQSWDENDYWWGLGTGTIVYAASNITWANASNIKVYNNDFINIRESNFPPNMAGVYLPNGTGNLVYNNLWYNSDTAVFIETTTNWNYNIFSDTAISPSANTNDIETTGDPFVNWINLDFRLNSATEPGLTLPAPYNYDMVDVERGADGNWDRGAIEYVGGVEPTQIKVEPSTTVEVGEEVYFDGSGVTITGAALLDNGMIEGSYEWDFGDDFVMMKGAPYPWSNNGGTSVSHFYTRVGTYTVTLNVTDVNGKNKIDTISITVEGQDLKLPPRPSVEPILELKFENNLQDSSGNNLDVLWQNGQGSFVKGIEGQAVDLGSSYIEVLDSPLLEGMDELTISIWARKKNPDASGYLLDKNEPYSMRLDYGSGKASVRGDITTQSSTATVSKWPAYEIVDEAWHHYVITYNGSLVRLFVDGIEFIYGSIPKGLTGAVQTSANNLLIGKKFDSPEIFEGYIDEVKIYDKALTPEEAHIGFELWHADFHRHTAQYIYAQIPGKFTKDSGNKINATIIGDNGYSKIIYQKNDLQSEKIFLLNNSELPAGNYTLTVQLLDSGNNLLDEIKEKFEKPYDSIPKVGIDENNAIRINGELFFPVTPWILGAGEMNTWKSYINVLFGQPWDYKFEDWPNYLDSANANNLQVIGPAVFEQGSSLHKNANMSSLIEYISTTKDHDALFMWAWKDEPVSVKDVSPAVVRSWTYKTRSLDPAHLVATTYELGSWIRGPLENTVDYATWTLRRGGVDYKYNAKWFGGKRTNIVDVASVDWYPITYQNLRTTDPPCTANIERVDGYALGLDRFIDENYNLVPVMTWVEATGSIPATPEQLKMLIWLNIVHGAKGINWFHYGGEVSDENFAVMAEFLDHITNLTPVVLSPETNRVITDNANTGGNRVDTLVREHEGYIYIFAVRLTEVNESQSGDDINVIFNVDNFGDGVAEVFNESRTINVVDGNFRDTFAPNAVHIYKMSEAGNVYYVDDDSTCGTGVGCGNDWTNAYSALPADLERGATYFIADGNYSHYTFDDPEDGEKYIYIKKAINSSLCNEAGLSVEECHGSASDWDESYGDEQAVFIGDTGEHAAGYDQAWRILKSYYLFDGQVGGGSDDWEGKTTPLGFKVTGVEDQNFITNSVLVVIGYPWPGPVQPHDIEIRHTEITTLPYRDEDPHNWTGGSAIMIRSGYAGETGQVGCDNVIIESCYIHHAYSLMHLSASNNWTIENNCFKWAAPSSYPDGTQSSFNKFYAPGTNIIYRNNLFYNTASGTASFAMNTGQAGTYPNGYFENISIYGNVFYNDDDCIGGDLGTSGGGVIGFWDDAYSATSYLKNIYIYNNAFVNIKTNVLYGGGSAGITLTENGGGAWTITNFQIKNNLFYNINQNSDPSNFFTNIPASWRSYNYFYNVTAGGSVVDATLATAESNGQVGTTDPFVNWTNLNFNLTSATNPSINFSWMNDIDMFGQQRGADGNWDRGAVEFVEGAPAGNVYYVDDLNGNDLWEGNSTHPWQTINKAFNTATYGDTVLIRNGTGNYGEINNPISFPTYAGSMIEPLPLDTEFVTFKADIGHEPVFTGITLGDSSDNNYIPYIFEGFRIDSPPDYHGITLIRAVGTRFKDLTITCQTRALGYGIELLFSGEHNNDIRIEDSSIDTFYRGIHGYGSNIVVRGNHIHDIISDILMLASGGTSGYNILIENNHMHHVNSSGFTASEDGIAMAILNNVIIRNNTIYESPQGIFDHGGDGYGSKNVLVENNVIYDIGVTELQTDPAALFPENWTIRNNTIVGANLVQRVFLQKGSNHNVYNNIFISDYIGSATLDYHDYNIYVNKTSSYGDTEPNSYGYDYLGDWDSTHAAIEPELFVNASSHDYRPKMDSIICNGSHPGTTQGVAWAGALPCWCISDAQCEQVFGIGDICDIQTGKCSSQVLTLSPFTSFWNWIKGLLTRETGQAILTGSVVGGGENKYEKPLITLVIAVVLIGLIIIIIIKARKIKKKKRKRIRRRKKRKSGK